MNGSNFTKKASELFDKAEKTMRGNFFGNMMKGK